MTRKLKAEVNWQTSYGGENAIVYGDLEDVMYLVRILMSEHFTQDPQAYICGDDREKNN